MTPAYLLPPLADQYAAFLRGVAAAPDCDTPRLVLADWLEEHAGTARGACERCKGEILLNAYTWSPGAYGDPCPDCKGDGSRWVSNGCGERTTFIRLQIAAAQADPCDRYADMKACSCPSCEECKWVARNGYPWIGLPTDLHRVWSRGFVDTVRGPLAALLEHLPGLGVELGLVEQAEVNAELRAGTGLYSPHTMLADWPRDFPRVDHAAEADAVAAISDAILAACMERAGLEVLHAN